MQQKKGVDLVKKASYYLLPAHTIHGTYGIIINVCLIVKATVAD